jgi:hydroxypyruvate isomerase
MKLSASDWCFFDGSVEPAEYYAALRDSGYEAVEMVEPERFEAARSAGLEILNLAAPGMEQGVNRRSRHLEMMPQMRACIDDASIAGIPQVIVFSGNSEGLSEEVGLSGCEEAFGPLAEYADGSGVLLTFEMLCLADHPGYQACSSRFGFALAEKLNNPAFRLLYDAYHMHRMGEDVIHDIRHYADWIAHIHLAEAPTRSQPIIGGDLGVEDVIATALDEGYTGYFGLEFYAPRPRLEAAKAAADHLSALFR